MRRVCILLLAATGLSACDAMPGPGSAAPAAATIAPGTALAFGEAATVCGLTEATLGTPVATTDRYTLWDSAGGGAEPRPHYITGLADDCAVQFTAALALFGDVATHEAVRYNAGNSTGYSATDTVYEQIKGQVCGAAQGQPCGDRIDDLAARMAFVTAYETFGTNADWYEILVHDGALVASGDEGG